MAISLNDLPGGAGLILSAFADQLTAQDVEVPDRLYVAAGSMIVWDGEQLTVCLMGVEQGEPGAGQAQAFFPPSAAHYYAMFSLNLVRQIQTVNFEGSGAGAEIPTAAEQNTDGVRLITDGAALILAAQALHAQNAIVDSGQSMMIGPLSPLGPEGGLAASRLLLSVSLS